MSKRHARRVARNRNPSKPRWRKEGRALQRDLALATKERDEARASDSSARDALDRLRDELEQRSERSGRVYAELEARYNAILEHVASAAALQPPAPIIVVAESPLDAAGPATGGTRP